jgi:hypothetical protein
MVTDIKIINDVLVKTGRLDHRVIGVYAADSRPAGAVTTAKVIRNGGPCLAKALFKMASHRDVPAIYIGEDVAKESCFGAMAWFGYAAFPPKAENMFISNSPSSSSMCIKENAEVCLATIRDMGKFVPAGKYVVMQALDDMDESPKDMRSVLCFGKSEQVRNLGGLIHFSEPRAFTPIMAPWGSGCGNFVVYPAGMAAGCPKDTAILSPFVPEGNKWFPEDMLALGIPIAMARRMAEGYGSSFAVKKPDIAYPAAKEIL